MTDRHRYHLAACLSAVLAVYVTLFARQTHDAVDLPTFIGVTEWPATFLTAAAAMLAFGRQAKPSAIALVAGLVAFYAAQSRWLFDVPFGFIVATLLAFATLFALPPDGPR